jgi:hypothetical protein
MVRSIVLREIRGSYLSIMRLKGWEIKNIGTHPVKLKDKKEIRNSMKNIEKIIKKDFLDRDIKKEFLELKKSAASLR